MLSDDKRRALYDAGMYDPLDDDQEDVEVLRDSEMYSPILACTFRIRWQSADVMLCAFDGFQGFHDFVQEMVSLMVTVGREVTAATRCSW